VGQEVFLKTKKVSIPDASKTAMLSHQKFGGIKNNATIFTGIRRIARR
jgi:hypothetical protein